MLKSFSVKKFRNLNIDDLQFKRINIFVGPNNSGKSNLIDAISLFSNLILSEKKESAFLDELAKRGWDDVLDRKTKKPSNVSMSWVLGTDTQHSDITYQLQFQVGSSDMISRGFYITEERLRYTGALQGKSEPFEFINCHGKTPGRGSFSVRDKQKIAQKVVVDVSQYDTVFRQMKMLLESEKFRVDFYPNFNKVVELVEDFFGRFCAYSSTDFDLRLVREPVSIQTHEKYLATNGSNFVNVLSYLDQDCDFVFNKYANILEDLIHGVTRVKFLDSGERKRGLALTIGDLTFKLSEMSDGTIKAMILALLLWTPQRMTILALDEPELNMHPAWLKVISGWVLRSDSADQIFISTHSPDFLDSFTAMFLSGEVGLYVFSLKEEESVKQVLPETIKESAEEGWELGDLYRVGDPLLGGWPW